MLDVLSLLVSRALLRDGPRPWSLPEGQVQAGLVSVFVVVLCVVLHYEVLSLLHRALPRLKPLRRVRILILILGLMLTHMIEVWIFAYGYAFIEGYLGFGQLVGGPSEGFLDYVYFSFTTYTSLGYGDFVPVGPLRFLSSIEVLSGLMLLGWSISFTFIEMQHFWK